MTRIPFPSEYPGGPQTEVCALCQRLVNVDELVIADVDGLEGLPICRYHAELRDEPSWKDLRGTDTALIEAASQQVREEPYGDPLWWESELADAGYILREDGVNYLYRENNVDAFMRES